MRMDQKLLASGTSFTCKMGRSSSLGRRVWVFAWLLACHCHYCCLFAAAVVVVVVCVCASVQLMVDKFVMRIGIQQQGKSKRSKIMLSTHTICLGLNLRICLVSTLFCFLNLVLIQLPRRSIYQSMMQRMQQRMTTMSLLQVRITLQNDLM